MWVSPFRYLRIKGYLLLPVAFRSLSRLSSALSAKASTLRSFLLDLVYSFYSVRNWVFAFNNADRIASILNFRSFGLVVNFVYDILGCLDKKSFHQNLLYEVFKVQQRTSFALEIASQFPSNGMFCNFNGDGEIRTHDPLLARQVLSQLSYTPN